MVAGEQAGRRFVAYLRVSTDRQGRSGLGLDAQREAVDRHVTSVGGQLIGEPLIETESGRRDDRPQLAAALAACRKHRAVLVIAKLDRLARDAHFLLGLAKAGVEFVAADMPHANRLTVGIMALVAEEEARMISARTKVALAAAKARGVKLGGVREGAGNLRPYAQQGGLAGGVARRKKAADHAADLAAIIAELDPAGTMSLGKLAKALTQRQVPTPRGGNAWSAVQVQRVKARLESA